MISGQQHTLISLDQAAAVLRAMVEEHAVVPKWLTLTEACRAFSLGKDRLMSLAKAGKIIGGIDSGDIRKTWRFEALSIHKYLLDATGQTELETKTLDAMKRFGL